MLASTRARRLGPALWALGVSCFWAIVNVRATQESDVFWHLHLGRSVLRFGARTFPELVSIESEGRTAVSQEWLWDVATYLLHLRFGAPAITVLVVVFAAAAAAACCALAWSWRPPGLDDHATGAFLIVTAAISPLVLTRIRERPETAAMLLLPAMMLVARKLAQAPSPKSKVSWALAVLGIQLLWTQLHPSFILGPVVVAILAGPELLVRPTRAPRLAAALALGLVACFFTNLPALAVLPAHTHGYAVAHIIDMTPPEWPLFNPWEALHLPLYVALWIMAIAAMLADRRIPWRPLLLALLGLAILWQARRGTGPAAILAIPLAMRSAAALMGRMPGRSDLRAAALGLIVGGWILVRTFQWVEVAEGEIGHAGFNPGAYPFGAIALLQPAPDETRALTSYASGPAIGFLLEGRVKSWVDSRTPLLFGDAEYATARAVWFRGDTLARATRRYGFDVAVVDRTYGICGELADSSDWIVGMIEPTFTTFVRVQGGVAARPLTTLKACGAPADGYVPDGACRADQGASLARDIDSMAAVHDTPFVGYLRAERLARCTPDEIDADRIVALLSPRRDALGFLAHRDGLLAWVYALADRPALARELVLPYLDHPWGPRDVAAVLPALKAVRDPAIARELLQLAYDALDELTPAWIHARLANVCANDRDEDCAELHALRAAALGAEEAGPALCWLAARHRSVRVRADATAWLQTLRAMPSNPASLGALACPQDPAHRP